MIVPAREQARASPRRGGALSGQDKRHMVCARFLRGRFEGGWHAPLCTSISLIIGAPAALDRLILVVVQHGQLCNDGTGKATMSGGQFLGRLLLKVVVCHQLDLSNHHLRFLDASSLLKKQVGSSLQHEALAIVLVLPPSD